MQTNMHRFLGVGILFLAAYCSTPPKMQKQKQKQNEEVMPTKLSAEEIDRLYSADIVTINGENTNLQDFRGKTLLIVNVASQCGLTSQYEGLENLYQDYRGKGVVVLGFPCNQFGGQEPGSEKEIKEFCRTNYGIEFPMFSKIEVNGPNRHPIYKLLTRAATKDGKNGDITWNFEKFVVRSDGTIHRFSPRTEPMDPELLSVLEN